jgi:hypothetical protein
VAPARRANGTAQTDCVLIEDGQDLGDGECRPLGGGGAAVVGDALLVGVGPGSVSHVGRVDQDELVVRLDDRDRRLVPGA